MEAEDGTVQVKQIGHRGAFVFDKGGKRIAELVFSSLPDGRIVILDHTEVWESLRGRGVGRKLVEAAVAWAREKGVKLLPLCPFAKAIFDREPKFGDVRA